MSNQFLTPTRLVLVLLSLLALTLHTGCSMVPKPLETTQIERSGFDVVVISEGQNASFFKDPKAMGRYCAAPEADVADTYKGGLTLKASDGTPKDGHNDTLDESQREIPVPLAGRSPEILLTREMLYRACELSLNIDADSQTAQEIYDRFLTAIVKISAAQLSAGTSAAKGSSGGSSSN